MMKLGNTGFSPVWWNGIMPLDHCHRVASNPPLLSHFSATEDSAAAVVSQWELLRSEAYLV
jgi:hypothetical protein